MADSYSPQMVLYGPAIQEARSSGDLQRMREMEQRAQQHLDEVTRALDELRSEIRNRSNS